MRINGLTNNGQLLSQPAAFFGNRVASHPKLFGARFLWSDQRPGHDAFVKNDVYAGGPGDGIGLSSRDTERAQDRAAANRSAFLNLPPAPRLAPAHRSTMAGGCGTSAQAKR